MLQKKDPPLRIVTCTNTPSAQSLIEKYAKTMGWQIGHCYDDGENGRQQNNGFDRMLFDSLNRAFDLVITDSLLHFGQDIWQAGDVLLGSFFQAGIQFAIVEDDFCSIGKDFEEVSAFFQKKYHEYRERNLKAKLLERGQKGLLSWSDAKYGYDLDENHRLVVNAQTAPVVKEIFALYTDGMEIGEIAEKLTKDQVLTPGASRGTKRKPKDPYLWTRRSVKDILERSVYAGSWTKCIQGETFSFTNEPIISEEMYARTKEHLFHTAKEFRPQKQKNKYHGFLVDPVHGHVFRSRTGSKGGTYFSYTKPEFVHVDGVKRITEQELDQAVTESLRNEQRRALVAAEQLSNPKKDSVSKTLLLSIGEQLAASEKERMDAYYQYEKGMISRVQYLGEEQQAKEKRIFLEEQFQEAKAAYEREQKRYSADNPWLMLFSEDIDFSIVTRELLSRYVDRIEIDGFSHITVIPREQNWKMDEENGGDQIADGGISEGR